MTSSLYRVVDLFSGAGGMSFGFHAHPLFSVVGAADAQLGKPSSPAGSLGCNETYAANIGVQPLAVDLSRTDPRDLVRAMGVSEPVDVLSACCPCTGFSRTNARNHVEDDRRNSLIDGVAEQVVAFRPKILVMENARELIRGRWSHHFQGLRERLECAGYTVHAGVHMLSTFGLPQARERALVLAVANGYQLRTLEDAWAGRAVAGAAVTVRRALSGLPALAPGDTDPHDPDHTAPQMSPTTVARMRRIPRDGGSWRDLLHVADGPEHMTPAMRRSAARGDFGIFPDVYGRMAWDRPAPTIKRECGHVGNGRYAHPEQNRLCSVRELAILNGFPRGFRFQGNVGNRYRHIGDAVPPLVSYQIASVCEWILTGVRPSVADLVLPGTHLRTADISDEEAHDVPAPQLQASAA